MHVYVSASEILKLARTWSTGMFCGSSIRGRSVCSLRGFTCVVYGTVCVWVGRGGTVGPRREMARACAYSCSLVIL